MVFSSFTQMCSCVFLFILIQFSIVSSVFLSMLIRKLLLSSLYNCSVWITYGSVSFAGHSSWISVVGACFQRGGGCYVWSAADLTGSFLQRWFSILLEGGWQHGQLTWITWGTWIPVTLFLGRELPRGTWNICLPFSLLAAGYFLSFSLCTYAAWRGQRSREEYCTEYRAHFTVYFPWPLIGGLPCPQLSFHPPITATVPGGHSPSPGASPRHRDTPPRRSLALRFLTLPSSLGSSPLSPSCLCCSSLLWNNWSFLLFLWLYSAFIFVLSERSESHASFSSTTRSLSPHLISL